MRRVEQGFSFSVLLVMALEYIIQGRLINQKNGPEYSGSSPGQRGHGEKSLPCSLKREEGFKEGRRRLVQFSDRFRFKLPFVP